jgi:hypothetical protein
MKAIHIQMLMGHSTGLDDSYYKPTEQELLEDYLKAVPLLTINDTITEERAEGIAKAAAVKATAIAQHTLEIERERHYREFDELKREQEKLRKMFDAFLKSGQIRVHPVDAEEAEEEGKKGESS